MFQNRVAAHAAANDDAASQLGFVHNDGGREAAGFKGTTGDCAVRAIAIMATLPYQMVYDHMNELAKKERTGKRKRKISNARTGVFRSSFDRYMRELGYTWVPCMKIGSGCKVHMRRDELPNGRLIVILSRHYSTVINGVVNDTYDCSRDGTRCVYGYWKA